VDISLTPRNANLAGFCACAGLMLYALFAQYGLELEPCPLCIFQRMGVILLGLVFLIAALHNPGQTGCRVYAVLIGLAAIPGIGVAGRHVWLQNLPPEQVPACGPGLDFMMDTFPFLEVLNMVLSGSGECAAISWSFLWLSMPAWVLIAVGCLALFGIWANWRRTDDPRPA
jgi:disulfide bond formation protein DsbB